MLKRNKFMIPILIGALVAISFSGFAADVKSAVKTVITSDSLMFDYGRSTCIFDGNVVVDDPRVKMECTKLHVFFDTTNSVDTIVATGSVKVWQADRRGVCDKAVYTAKTGTILMTGKPRLQSGNNLVRGDEIKIFVNSEKVVSSPKARLVVFPEEIEKERKPPKR